jgi:hypothetical protein
MRRQGLGAELVRHALERHPEYEDMLAADSMPAHDRRPRRC